MNAKKIQLSLIPLINVLFSEVNSIPLKYLMNELGYNVGIPHLSLIEFSDAGKEKLKVVLEKIKNL